jgi:hypothetical protein
MSGKFPNDRVRDAKDAPDTYDRHRERFSQAEAAMREADDRVSGARPDTQPVEPVPEQRPDEDGDSDA